jgi:membrane dipeptidase
MFLRSIMNELRHSEFPIFDGHNDTLLNLHFADRGGGRSFMVRNSRGHIDLPRAREGGLAGGLFAIFVPAPGGKPGPLAARAIRTADGYRIPPADPIDPDHARRLTAEIVDRLRGLESDGALRVACDIEVLQRCRRESVLSAVLHFEGAEAIDPGLQNLATYYELGLRSLGITWSRPNAFGYGVPFQFPASPDTGPGLTPAGQDLVRACNHLGIQVDLAHLNARGFWDVAGISRAPLVVSHSAAHALVPKSRNLTDDQLEAVADSDGLVGVTFASYDLCSDGRIEGDVPLSAIAHHIEYIANRIGIQHVALGSDFDGTTIPAQMKDVTGLPKLIADLRSRGFSDDQLRQVTWSNWIRVLGAAWER